MLIGLLLSILTATYTLAPKNTLQPEGDVPSSSIAHFQRSSTTGRLGQMTAGNSTHLRLEGWDGCTIRSVKLKMHSNGQSGAGTLDMKVGGNQIWKIDELAFCDPLWSGKYTTDWVDICKDVQVQVGSYEDVDILITATENSLYISQYVIEYEPAPMACYTVEFNTGMDSMPRAIIQSELGGVVILPTWCDTLDWYFVGWSEIQVLENDEVVELLHAGSDYIPKRNTQLWAVYSDVKERIAVRNYTTNRYVMTMWNPLTEYFAQTGMAMCGNVNEETIQLCGAELETNETGEYCWWGKMDESMVYQLEIEEDSTLTIVHEMTGEYIGYKGNKLSSESEIKWTYKILSDGSMAIYTQYEQPTNIYALNFVMQGSIGDFSLVAKMQKIDIHQWTEDGFWLFPILYPRYTSWPLGPKDDQDNDEDMEDEETLSTILNKGTYLMHWGEYAIYAKDKKKYLIPIYIVQ